MRRIKRLIAVLALLSTAMVSCDGDELGAGHYRWEGIRGFAVWPEDNPEEGLEACESRLDVEPWRNDPAATTDRFLRSVLGWTQPPDLSRDRVREDAPRTVYVVSDGEMPQARWASPFTSGSSGAAGSWPRYSRVREMSHSTTSGWARG